LVNSAREEGVTRITADILNENQGMQRVCRTGGFHLGLAKDGVVEAEHELDCETARVRACA
ncbi:hypothetical protein, partial [Thioalkalivibrio sp.]|uniref:hypothetical protein n=1 Tax=Thioalkalivibrio sp. TaxID=2093813 RepID=UPI0039749112